MRLRIDEGLSGRADPEVSCPRLQLFKQHISGVDINEGGLVLGSLDEGSYRFGSLLGAPDFWKLPKGVL